MVGDTLGTPVPGTTPGGVDGFLAQVDPSGTRTWTRQLGTSADEQLWGVAADAAGNATVAGFASGDLSPRTRATRMSSSRASTRRAR